MFTYAKPEPKQMSNGTVQKKEDKKKIASPNLTGIPDTLKMRFENLSGFSFDDVRIHYNSDKPAHLQALAYTQGNHVYIESGQEKHLEHELGHVVQQKQGHVPATFYLNGLAVNDDLRLERQADEVGKTSAIVDAFLTGKESAPPVIQGVFINAEEAEAAFGANFTPKHIALIAEMNQIVESELAHDQDRKTWMEGLNHATRMSVLHQIYQDGNAERIRRICNSLLTIDPQKYPNPINDSVCWGFLIEITSVSNPHPYLGELGELPKWVSTLKTIYSKADRHIVNREISAFYEAALEGRRHLSSIRSNIPSDKDPTTIMKYLADQIKALLKGLYVDAATALGLKDFCLLAVGSLAREEFFPYSDLDYALLVEEVSEKIELVEKMINIKLSIMGEQGLDTIGVGKPEDVAFEHVTEKKNVLLDASFLSGDTGLWDRYSATRSSEMSKPHDEAANSLIESETAKYSPKGQYLSKPKKDVKKGLLRLPIFIVRNLCYYYNITEATNINERVQLLLNKGIIRREIAEKISFVTAFAAELRIKCHLFYGEENDTFILPNDVKSGKSADCYVLDTTETTRYQLAESYNMELEKLSNLFSSARTKLRTLDDLLNGFTMNKEESTAEITIFKTPDNRMAQLHHYEEFDCIQLFDDTGKFQESYWVQNKLLVAPIISKTPHKTFVPTENNPFA